MLRCRPAEIGFLVRYESLQRKSSRAVIILLTLTICVYESWGARSALVTCVVCLELKGLGIASAAERRLWEDFYALVTKG